jgi:hypothetical protein
MAIAPLTKPVANYIKEFGLTSLCRYRDGRVGVSRDPSGAEHAFWLNADLAGMVLQIAKGNGGDIEAAARKAKVEIADHATVLARAEVAVAKISNKLDQAQRTGVLHAFNEEYRRRRLQAFASGKNFMSYQQARARLQRVLTGVAATGNAPAAIMKTVFEGEGG